MRHVRTRKGHLTCVHTPLCVQAAVLLSQATDYLPKDNETGSNEGDGRKD